MPRTLSKTLIALMFFLTMGCDAAVENPASQLEEQLNSVQSAAEEKQILQEVWALSYDSEGEVDMTVRAVDAKGSHVIQDLSSAVSPITVTIHLQGPNWEEEIEFVPLDIENVYVLLNE